MSINLKDIQARFQNEIDNLHTDARLKNQGEVVFAGDGIIKIKGLDAVKYGELIEVGDHAHAIALNLEEDQVGAVLLQDEALVKQGDTVHVTGRITEVPVGEELLGRVINPLGKPIDGGSPIHTLKRRPIEMPAPSIPQRDQVREPLQTGILAIDSMISIGKGQRELIIGDRQTGKTAIAIDTIINQKGKDVLCVYVAIGQKASTITNIVNVLKNRGCLKHTVVVCSTARDSSALQYIAPYAGCSIAEEFMLQGKDVLIVYDDLSKHAVAYRTMSLLLKRPPGREAYPGDIFYLHSRLLERAAKLSKEMGGGSLTALPIVETQAGDISQYIPTNVISITDGQIFLESELFNSGFRPAVNVGLSVSRVGGNAQVKAMRQVVGKLRLDLAQYRELAVFKQFGSDLDSGTKRILAHGDIITWALKQKQYKPYTMEQMIVILYAMNNGLVDDIGSGEIVSFNTQLIRFISIQFPVLYTAIKEKGELDQEITEEIKKATKEFKGIYGK